MLPPDSLLTRVILSVALAGLLALLVWRAARKDRHEYQLFKRLSDTVDRQRVFRKWIVESLAFFGGSAAIILLLAGGYVPRMLAQVERYPLTRVFRGFVSDGGDLFAGIVTGLVVAVVGGSILVVVLLRSSAEVPTVGDIAALLPRNRRELGYGAALSVNAGLVEELLFRFALPALVFGITGNALISIVGSVLLFAALHLYQGAGGVVGSLVIGVLLMLLYLATGSILWPILAHALFDLRSLVLIPMVIYGVHWKAADAPAADVPVTAPTVEVPPADATGPTVPDEA